MKPRVLAIVEHYLPGYKAGGPVRTVSNMVEGLREHVQFWVVSSDRDYGDAAPYHHVRSNAWNECGNAQVFYASPRQLRSWDPVWMVDLVHTIRPDFIYLNSFFAPTSVRFAAWRRADWFGRERFLLAPRGEFSPGALAIKSSKKKAYLALVRRTGLYGDMGWQASSDREAREISQVFPAVRAHVAPDMVAPEVPARAVRFERPAKTPGTARFVFLSRISPKKNLDYALEVLRDVTGNVVFDIYGTRPDAAYGRTCRSLAAKLPKNVLVHDRGPVPHDEVFAVLAQYHYFLLPTRGENFGHAIFEAFAAGCVPLISNETPWLGLCDRNLGWDLPLGDRTAWRNQIQSCVDLPQTPYVALAAGCRDFARSWVRDPSIVRANCALFAPEKGGEGGNPMG